MTPATNIAETAFCDQKPLIEETIIHKQKNISEENCSYESLLNKDEPWFMKPIRRWEKRMGFQTPLRWLNLIFICLFHCVALGWILFYIIYRNDSHWKTIAFGFLTGGMAGFGVTAGAHRYWCHRSYKAKYPLQFILLLCYSIAGQNKIFDWVRDHRVHHKFSESSADPHDANRGFFFSHVGWLMMRKHPAVIREGKKINMSDIINDPLVQFHTRYFTTFKILFCFVIPMVIPVYFWSETLENAFISQALLRYMLSLNFTWSVNSFAHIWGNKPYDRHIMPAENWGVSFVALGEGWHNYHHTFPWDYKASEIGYCLNFTTFVLDFFSKLGWAYDMKIASPSLVTDIARRKGDCSIYKK